MDGIAKILVVDDDSGNADYIGRILANFNHDIYTDPGKALESFSNGGYDLIVTDQKMPEMTGIELIKACREISDDFLGIIISAYTDSDDLIDAVNSNVIHKYIIKPFTPDILIQHVHRSYEMLTLVREKKKLERKLREDNVRLSIENSMLQNSASEYGLNRIAGHSEKILALKERISTYANSNSSVLITGETGTGKELVAMAMHELSMRRTKPFIKINCTTLSSGLVESELFGYEKGSFTGAGQEKKGFFEAADGGTIFLDEIGDLALDVQPKLLRVIQFGTFYPVGGRKEKHTDVRIIAATNSNLEEAVKSGKFRKDLYHRLNVLRLRIPSLREHKEDIPEIFEKLMTREYGSERFLSFTKDALEMLTESSFNGNVRELETYMHRLELICKDDRLVDAEILREVLEPVQDLYGESSENKPDLTDHDLKAELESMEKEKIEKALMENGYNITKTAGALGLSRQGLHNKLKRYRISRRH